MVAGEKINYGRKKSRYERDLLNVTATNNIQLGYVRKSADPQRMGRLTVWIPEFGPDLDASYIVVGYGAPFAGATPITNNVVDGKGENDSQRSYGIWAVPPDEGNMVLVCFVNGDPSRGYWLGCVYQQNMNQMVPGIGMNTSTSAELNKTFAPYYPPTVEYNKKDSTADPKSPARPADNELAQALIAQGLTHDPERGVSNASARREDTSLVSGWLTPGGNSMSFDDDPTNSNMRFRTKNGTQVLISDTSGFVYIVTRNGNSWVEISDGAIEMYSSSPISLRSEDDINIQGDRNVNISAGADLNLHANGNIRGQAGANVEFTAGAALNATSGGKMSLSATGDLAGSAGGNMGLSANATMVVESGGDNVRNGAQILDNSGGASAVSADQAQFTAASTLGGGTSSICSKQPSHEPYQHPINSVVDANVTYSAAGGVSTVRKADGTTVAAVTKPDNSPVQSIGKFKVSQNVLACIYQASQRTGVPFGNLMAIASQESGFRASVKAGTSSATGLFQFTSSTYATMYSKYGPNGTKVKNPGVLNNASDPCSNALMGAYFYKENAAGLAAAGLPTDCTSVYMAHFLGLGGARTFLRALQSNPGEPASSAASSAAAAANASVFNGRTVQGVYNFFNAKVGATVPQWNAYQAKAAEQAASTTAG